MARMSDLDERRSNDKKALAMAERLVDEYKDTPEGKRLDPVAVRDIIAGDTESAARAVSVLIQVCVEHKRSLWGLLMISAELFTDITGDDSLELLVSSEMKKAGIQPPRRTEIANPEGPGSDAAPHGTYVFKVAIEDIKVGSAYRTASFFALSSARRDALEQMLGRVHLNFPLDHDPRHLWDIPEVCAFMADLHRLSPQFPMFLNFAPAAWGFQIYFFPLVRRGQPPLRESDQINIAGDEFVTLVNESLDAARRACDEFRLDYAAVVANVLQLYPEKLRHRLFPRHVGLG